jgi:hypothetical protein
MVYGICFIFAKVVLKTSFIVLTNVPFVFKYKNIFGRVSKGANHVGEGSDPKRLCHIMVFFDSFPEMSFKNDIFNSINTFQLDMSHNKGTTLQL